MSICEDVLGLGVPTFVRAADVTGIPFSKEVEESAGNVAAALRAKKSTLVSMLNRIVLSPTIYRIDKLETFQFRNAIVLSYGAFGQVMRFVAYVVYAEEEAVYKLRLDDVFSGLISYLPLSAMDRSLPKDKVSSVENQIISSLAGILAATPSDWQAIWDGYQDRAIDFDSENEQYDRLFENIAEMRALVDACDDDKALDRVDLHLTHYTYDRLRFTILDGEVGVGRFKRDSAIYIPENRLVDYGSKAAESILESFVNPAEVAAFVDECVSSSRVSQHKNGLVVELQRMSDAIDDIDLQSEAWVRKKFDLKQQLPPSPSDPEGEEEDDDDAGFETPPEEDFFEKVAEDDVWSLHTESDSDGEGDLVWSEIGET